jgi:hypothetical protein
METLAKMGTHSLCTRLNLGELNNKILEIKTMFGPF